MNAEYWLAILVLGALVYVTRVIGLVAIPSSSIAPSVERGLRLVPVAILTALAAPHLISPTGVPEPAALIAAAVTAAIASLTRYPVVALIAGVVAVVGSRAIL